mgnify:CR=1 FL=1
MFNFRNGCACLASGSVRRWARAEDGAVTVDWVVLTATLAVIGGTIVTITSGATENIGTQVGDVLRDVPVTE